VWWLFGFNEDIVRSTCGEEEALLPAFEKTDKKKIRKNL